MTKAGWQKYLNNLDEEKIEMLSQLLYEHDEAKNLLSKAGLSYTGLSMLESIKNTIKIILEAK
jgi:hypothetical protein